MRVAATIAPLALLATSCGGSKQDPYAKSLAMGSEHVEITADLSAGRHLVGSGDFTNAPDRGRYSFTVDGKPDQRQVFANGRIYVYGFGKWLTMTMTVHTPQTPAQMFRAHLPAKIENGLVRSITLHSHGSVATYVFSKYGEPVSITIPRVKGSK